VDADTSSETAPAEAADEAPEGDATTASEEHED
jgi:hypothetical protein